ncbi:MAG: class I SAM-dependent RNA methyltransferase [Puniceicoccaceae bacterium]|nr:MAG: class I SAM-dependent RNA methyltransferase [Puniceicoccaceae bacterium]
MRPRRFNPVPFPYHHELELEITTLTNHGHGLGRVELDTPAEEEDQPARGGWVVLVAFALPGERVRVRVFRNHKNHSEADLVAVLRASPHRVEPVCPVFGECGGCQYQNLDYTEQLHWKRRQVAELLEHLGGVSHPVDPVVPSPLAYGYRSKITPHFQPPRRDRPLKIGFLRQGTRSALVDVEACPLASPAMNGELTRLRAAVLSGEAGYRSGATLLLRETAADGVVTDARQTVTEEVDGVRLRFPAGEFFQNNPHILEAFTAHVAAEAAGAGARFLIDAYCGSGLFCLTAGRRFQAALGVEINEHSLRWAVENARENGLESTCSFRLGDAAAIFEGIPFAPAETAVVIDPPRKGASEAFLEQLAAFGPRTVVYVSCNPATQMRDLKLLRSHGFGLRRVQPFDLFPQTRHLECVLTLDGPDFAGEVNGK